LIFNGQKSLDNLRCAVGSELLKSELLKSALLEGAQLNSALLNSIPRFRGG